VSDVSAPVWILTVLGLVAITVLDLRVIARRQREVTTRDAALWVAFYVGLAAAFAVALFLFRSRDAGNEFVAGYITEYSLSVDNLFVFVIIMARFGVPAVAQDKALYIGIVLSMLMRAAFIAAGAAAIAATSWVFYIFGAFLVYTAVRLALEGENDEDDFQENAVLRALRRRLPLTTSYDGSRLATRAGGRRMWTPLVIVIAAIGMANVVFALDSIPAIFGLTQDAYIVITANAFALMGLRQLYFLLGDLLNRIVYLNIGLSIILAFIGVKLLIEALRGSGVEHVGPMHIHEIGITASLAFIFVTLLLTTLASLGKTALAGRDAG
jgi:TerC family integral membrane protein